MDNEENNHLPARGEGTPLEPWVDPAMEARIVALVLGEASEFERSELERAIAEQPEFKAFYDRISGANDALLLGATLEPEGESAPWRLPAEKREDLLKKFRSHAEDEPAASATGSVSTRDAVMGRRRLRQRNAVLMSIAATIVLLLAGSLLMRLTLKSTGVMATADEKAAPTLGRPEGSSRAWDPEPTFGEKGIGDSWGKEKQLEERSERLSIAAGGIVVDPKPNPASKLASQLPVASAIASADSFDAGQPSFGKRGSNLREFARTGEKFALPADPGVTGDFDQGIGNAPDDSFVNRPEDGEPKRAYRSELDTYYDDLQSNQRTNFGLAKLAESPTSRDGGADEAGEAIPQDKLKFFTGVAKSKVAPSDDPIVAAAETEGEPAQPNTSGTKTPALGLALPQKPAAPAPAGATPAQAGADVPTGGSPLVAGVRGGTEAVNGATIDSLLAADGSVKTVDGKEVAVRFKDSNLAGEQLTSERERLRGESLFRSGSGNQKSNGVDFNGFAFGFGGGGAAGGGGASDAKRDGDGPPPVVISGAYLIAPVAPGGGDSNGDPFGMSVEDNRFAESGVAQSGDQAVKWAIERAQEGNIEEAKRQLGSVLATAGNEDAKKRAKTVLDRLDDSEYYNQPASGPQGKPVKETERLASLAEGISEEEEESDGRGEEVEAESRRRGLFANKAKTRDRDKNLGDIDEHWEFSVPADPAAPESNGKPEQLQSNLAQVGQKVQRVSGQENGADISNSSLSDLSGAIPSWVEGRELTGSGGIPDVGGQNVLWDDSAPQPDSSKGGRSEPFKDFDKRGKELAGYAIAEKTANLEQLQKSESGQPEDVTKSESRADKRQWGAHGGPRLFSADLSTKKGGVKPAATARPQIAALESELKEEVGEDSKALFGRTAGVYNYREDRDFIDSAGDIGKTDKLSDPDSIRKKRGLVTRSTEKDARDLPLSDLALVEGKVLKEQVVDLNENVADAPEILVAKRSIELAKKQKSRAEAGQKHQPDLSLETLTSSEPFSTFSLNVSDVSFKLAATALLKENRFPEAAKIRAEEFVNAFDYGDPAPSLAERVSCTIDQSAHPFLQQRNLMRVAMRTAAAGRAAGTPLRLTILLDKSGSMERADREESVLRTMRALSKHLGAADKVTAIAFARQPRLIAEQLPGDRAAELVDLVAATPSEGGTNLEEALALAEQIATRQFEEKGVNRVVLITDGAANLGDADPESLKQRVIGLRQQGIAFDACGVGADGLNDATLEALTRKGDGRYYFLDRPEDADANFVRQLAGSLRPAAKNVKVQVKFNPERVTRYRLVGFEKHRLKKEDFRNDKVDAAEMAAAESGNAIYQFETDPQGSGAVGEVFVRFRDMDSGQMVERSWPIPYEPQAPRLGDACAPIQLASTAALLAEKLKGGAPAGAISLGELTPITNQLRAAYPQDKRVSQLIQMVERARSLGE